MLGKRVIVDKEGKARMKSKILETQHRPNTHIYHITIRMTFILEKPFFILQGRNHINRQSVICFLLVPTHDNFFVSLLLHI